MEREKKESAQSNVQETLGHYNVFEQDEIIFEELIIKTESDPLDNDINNTAESHSNVIGKRVTCKKLSETIVDNIKESSSPESAVRKERKKQEKAQEHLLVRKKSDPSRRRVSFTQLEALWDFVNKNREIATGFNKTTQAREYSRRMWLEVADQLNSLGDGASKDWKGWCKYWNDYKSKIKKVAAAARSSHKQTEGGPSGIKPMTDIAIKFLDILGADFGEGLPGIGMEPFEEEVLPTAALTFPSANASEEESPSILAMFPAEQPSTQAPGPSWRESVPLSQTTQAELAPSSPSLSVAIPPPPATTPPPPSATQQSTSRRSPRRRRLRRKPPISQDAARRALIRVAKEKLELARHRNRIKEEKVELERHRNILLGALVEELRKIKQILRSRGRSNIT